MELGIIIRATSRRDSRPLTALPLDIILLRSRRTLKLPKILISKFDNLAFRIRFF